MHKIAYTYFLIFFLSLISIHTHAQQTCGETLKDAEDMFEAGQLSDIPVMLSECIHNGLTKEERIRALRLVTIAYLYLDYQSKADETYLALLKLSPEYQPNIEIDPHEYILHAKKFTTSPFYTFHVNIGMNYSYYQQMQYYSMGNSLTGDKSAKGALGFNIGVGAEYRFYDNLTFGVEFLYTQTKFQISETQFQSQNQAYISQFTHKYTYANLPLYVKYTRPQGQFRPFVLVGVVPSRLFSANSGKLVGVIQNSKSEQSFEALPIDLRPLRKEFNLSALAGVGFNYKVGIHYITVDLRVNLRLLNEVKTDNRFLYLTDPGYAKERTIHTPGGYIDDDFKVHTVSLMVGYQIPLYKPRKITK